MAQCPISAGTPCPGNGSRIWFVNPVSSVHADFQNLQDAIDDANVLDGDTIYVEASGSSHGDITVDKQLYIIGAGDFLWQNDSMQANKDNKSEVDDITFVAGSEGSVMMGMYAWDGRIFIQTDSIRIQHNQFLVNTGAYYYVLLISGGTVADPITGVGIFQNYFYIRNVDNTLSNTAILINCVSDQLYIENNIIISSAYDHGGHRTRYSIRMTDVDANAQIRNNYLYGAPRLRNALFENNFVALGDWSYLGYVNYAYGHTYNNYADKTNYFNNGDERNMNNQNLGQAAFQAEMKCPVDHHESWGLDARPDTCYQLSATATARDNGYGTSPIDGTQMDVGPYDGNLPYAPSGMPFIPSIFYFDGPALVSDPTMSVRIKARTHH
jgi:hypothetical protein